MMKNPPHPGIGIRDEIVELGLSIAEAAKGLGVTRQQLHRVINGQCAITPEMALRLEKSIGSNADFWLRLQINYDLAKARARGGSLRATRLERKVA
ncbi:MAG: HigA family addiction module antidote protein [Hyphomicrobiales bacterium]|nr:HigA family addiction module antidote protein [Hyphomicrobiales bacterium]MBV9112686.1 HigA family addiction module antidote protein [Hyphomicrobiales bacterium]